MPRPGPRLIDDFLIPALNTKKYGDKLMWVNQEKKIFSMKWSHKSCGSWTEEDTIVFQDWDKQKGNYDPGKKDYLMYSKQRFRSALNKLNVRKLKVTLTFSNKDMRIYQLRSNEVRKNLQPNIPSQNMVDNRMNRIEAAEALLELQKSIIKCDHCKKDELSDKFDAALCSDSEQRNEAMPKWSELNMRHNVGTKFCASQSINTICVPQKSEHINTILSMEGINNDSKGIK